MMKKTSTWSALLPGPALRSGAAAVLLLAAMASAPAAWAHDCEVDGIYYNLNDSAQTASVTSGDIRYIGAVQIPEEIAYGDVTYRVTAIGASAFKECISLTEVTIPNSVTTIGSDAFWSCNSLTEVTIPASVTTIDHWAFYGCRSLEAVHISDLAAWCRIQFVSSPSNPLYYARHLYIDGEEVTRVVIPDDVTEIGAYTFYRCDSLTEVTIPAGVTAIGEDAFRDCSSLTAVHISDLAAWYRIQFENEDSNPLYYAHHLYIDGEEVTKAVFSDDITEIGAYAFSGCSSLTEVTIPEGVTKIGTDAFAGCSSLTAVHISDLDAWCRIQFGYYASNPLYYAHHLYIDGEEVTKVVIPDDVTEINYTFAGSSSLTEVTIPEGVTTIGRYAFYGCSSLTEVTIPEGVTTIGADAFYGCSSLTEVTIPEGVTAIGQSAFSDCSSLTEVTIPESVTTIGGSAFARCRSLTEMTIPEGVTMIETSTFYRCSGLTAVTIPESVTTIGQNAFYGCSSLTEVTIPESVTTIGREAFYECSSLTEVTIPEGVTEIGGGAFRYCSSLTEVTIPESVTTIGYNAFYNCSSLTEVTIPESVTTIGYDAFSGCSSLQKIYCLNPTPPEVTKFGSLYTSPFDEDTHSSVPLFVPAESVELYAATDPWSRFATIRAIGDEEEEPTLYVLTYQLDGEIYRTDTLAYGATIEPAEAPEAPEGYSFSGWVGLPETMPAEDITVEGWFEVNYYTLTWMVDGEVYLTETLAYGATIVAPEAPELEGYDFGGWMNVPATMPAHDLVIYSSFTTGVASLPADGAGRGAIYTLEGLRLGTTDLSILPAGTYIVGGRKVTKR